MINRFADNGRAPEFMHKVYDPFLEQVDHRVVELWKAGDWKTFIGIGGELRSRLASRPAAPA